jgi:hypothetical protein
MNVLKRMMVALLALLPLATGMAFAENEHGYSRIFIFGASFMDSGNHFADTGLPATALAGIAIPMATPGSRSSHRIWD